MARPAELTVKLTPLLDIMLPMPKRDANDYQHITAAASNQSFSLGRLDDSAVQKNITQDARIGSAVAQVSCRTDFVEASHRPLDAHAFSSSRFYHQLPRRDKWTKSDDLCQNSEVWNANGVESFRENQVRVVQQHRRQNVRATSTSLNPGHNSDQCADRFDRSQGNRAQDNPVESFPILDGQVQTNTYTKEVVFDHDHGAISEVQQVPPYQSTNETIDLLDERGVHDAAVPDSQLKKVDREQIGTGLDDIHLTEELLLNHFGSSSQQQQQQQPNDNNVVATKNDGQEFTHLPYQPLNTEVCEIFELFRASEDIPAAQLDLLKSIDAAHFSYSGEPSSNQSQSWQTASSYSEHNGLDIPKGSISLDRWIGLEGERGRGELKLQKMSILRKLAVSFGICKLLSATRGQDVCSIDNLYIQEHAFNSGDGTRWVIAGITLGTIPPLSVQLASSPVNDKNNIAGVQMTATLVNSFTTAQDAAADEKTLCCTLGILIHYIFGGSSDIEGVVGCDDLKPDRFHPAKKKPSSSFTHVAISSRHNGSNAHDENKYHVAKAHQFGTLTDCPLAITQLVRDLHCCYGDGLFRSDTAFKSLDEAAYEISLLLKEPDILLFGSNESRNLRLSTTVFGREAETKTITDAYHRVCSFEGQSELIIVYGLSGIGKTKLVENAIDQTKSCGDGRYAVVSKFEQVSRKSCLGIVISTFDAICLQIAQSKAPDELIAISSSLVREFSSNIHQLTSALPSATLILPSDVAATQYSQDKTVNLCSLSFTIIRFMKVLSVCGVRGVVFMDDLQWADQLSIKLVQSIICSCDQMFFIGSYRTDDLPRINEWRVPLRVIHLDGLPEEDTNQMISHALSMVPRLCAPLSAIIHRKTRGSPFFVGTFLRSLVDNKLVSYSLRDRRWVYDLDAVATERITDNVLYLITKNMNTLSEDRQNVLKALSCFGTKVSSKIVALLSETKQYANIKPALANLVQDGFLEECDGGALYCFPHDRVHESAYQLINVDDRIKLHFELGMVMYPRCSVNDFDTLLKVIEQINYGVPTLLRSPSEQMVIAELNYQAGIASFDRYDYGSALDFFNAAKYLLPSDSWESAQYYSLSLGIHLQLAKAAHACAEIDIASSALKTIDQKALSLEDKLDAYALLIEIHQHDENNITLALNTCLGVLATLGVNLPSQNAISINALGIKRGMQKLESIMALGMKHLEAKMSSFTSESSMMSMSVATDIKTINIMRFFWLLVLISYRVHTQDFHLYYYTSRWLEFILNNSVLCRYTPIALSHYSAMLVHGFDSQLVLEGYRLGKIALKFLDEINDQSSLPGTYMCFYGYTGMLFEPIQACLDQHRKAFEIGMQLGNHNDAFHNVCFLIPRMIQGGVHLGTVMKEINSCQRLANTHSHPILETYLNWYMDCITLLLDVDSNMDNMLSLPAIEKCKITDSTAIYISQMLLPVLYLGWLERVQFFEKKWDSLDQYQRSKVPYREIMMAFYTALGFTGMYRRKPAQKLLSKIKRCINVLEMATSLSEWNYKNKYLLVLAEKLSIENSDQAEREYENAIQSAKEHKFIHEEGFASQLAGEHYERKGNDSKALALYKEAKRCYLEWGSQKKVLMMNEVIDRLCKHEQGSMEGDKV